MRQFADRRLCRGNAEWVDGALFRALGTMDILTESCVDPTCDRGIEICADDAQVKCAVGVAPPSSGVHAIFQVDTRSVGSRERHPPPESEPLSLDRNTPPRLYSTGGLIQFCSEIEELSRT